jgi:hypothetical protein
MPMPIQDAGMSMPAASISMPMPSYGSQTLSYNSARFGLNANGKLHLLRTECIPKKQTDKDHKIV